MLRSYLRNHHVALLALFVALGSTSIAATQLAASPSSFTACGKPGKTLRLAPSGGKCRKGERRLKVPLKALAGAQGIQGPPGPKGDPGSNATLPALESPHAVGAAGEPAFQNTWGNVGGTWAHATFFKDQLGLVHLEGRVAQSSGSVNLIFTLPAGYRPAGGDRQFHTSSCCLSSSTGGEVYVGADGTVSYQNGDRHGLSLDGIAFRAG